MLLPNGDFIRDILNSTRLKCNSIVPERGPFRNDSSNFKHVRFDREIHDREESPAPR